ncbi:hypothetical protein THIOKS11070001 [Thiocapsa sp. KS1]|nr:hypothetical protein THIOKS11070001 [Thiocapsa sp. KS1]
MRASETRGRGRLQVVYPGGCRRFATLLLADRMCKAGSVRPESDYDNDRAFNCLPWFRLCR